MRPSQPPAGDRSRRLGALLARLWDRRILPRPRLAEIAEKADRLEDGLGPRERTPWRPALARLLASLAEEARLNEVGLTFACVQLSGLLKQRERAFALWREHPEIAGLDIPSPVIVLGHMRSGTTRLQRLFGCDERFHHTRFHEVMAPLPERPDWRVLKSRAQLALLHWLNPQIRAVHPTSATSIEEQFGLLSFSFCGAQIEAQWRVPGFARYWEEQDRTWVYRELKQLLQTLAWQRGGAPRPWVLKAPQFMEDLAALLEVFPDCRLVCLNRDPAEVVGSSASLVWNQMTVQSDHVDPHWIGAEWLHKTVRRERICTEIRRVRSDVPQIDLAFAAMNRDALGEMRRAYEFLGLELTPRHERRMEAYLKQAETSGFRRHSYRLEDYGLDAETARLRIGG